MKGPYNIGSCDNLVACEIGSQYLSISIDTDLQYILEANTCFVQDIPRAQIPDVS